MGIPLFPVSPSAHRKPRASAAAATAASGATARSAIRRRAHEMPSLLDLFSARPEQLLTLRRLAERESTATDGLGDRERSLSPDAQPPPWDSIMRDISLATACDEIFGEEEEGEGRPGLAEILAHAGRGREREGVTGFPGGGEREYDEWVYRRRGEPAREPAREAWERERERMREWERERGQERELPRRRQVARRGAASRRFFVARQREGTPEGSGVNYGEPVDMANAASGWERRV